MAAPMTLPMAFLSLRSNNVGSGASRMNRWISSRYASWPFCLQGGCMDGLGIRALKQIIKESWNSYRCVSSL